MTVDEIRLTLPADEAFHGVAHLVVGGLAVRLDLTVENLEDLELALDSLLARTTVDEDVTLRVLVTESELRTIVGPFSALRSEFEDSSGDSLNLRRILSAVCDSVEIEDRDGAEWVQLTKRVQTVSGAA